MTSSVLLVAVPWESDLFLHLCPGFSQPFFIAYFDFQPCLLFMFVCVCVLSNNKPKEILRLFKGIKTKEND